MRLKSFHVRLFRNVIDSGPIEVVQSTCLVGKNEAGKSSIIEALHRLNPAKPAPLVLLDDYPRWLKKQHEIDRTIGEAIPIAATFELSPGEIKVVSERFGTELLASPAIVAKRKYTGEMILEFQVDHTKFIHAFSKAHLTSAVLGKTSGDQTTQAFLAKLTEIASEVGENKESTAEAIEARKAKDVLGKLLGGQKTMTAALDAMLRPLVPKTFYFADYQQLRGRYNLVTEVVPALGNASPDESINAAADFLKLAKIADTNVQAWDFEQSNSELEAISSMLTQLVKRNWKQNQHLKLRVNIESVPSSTAQPDRYLQFRVEDIRHDFSNRLDRRSTGFRWFVSFVASFFDFQSNNNIILLLDEPGLSLHARAQKDLLDAIDGNLTGGRQVIYTTHSPFMVRTESLDKVRIVEDKGPDIGAVVTNDAGAVSDPDTLFPLQAALGYDVAQSLFIGDRNILLEGTSDFIYLNVFSSYLASLRRPSIPPNSRLLPAGGATNIPTFIALLGGKLNMVVLLDGNAQRQKIDAAIADGRLKASNVLRVDQFCSVKGADIEDLFSPNEYLSLYNDSLAENLTTDALVGTDRIVKKIERARGAFNHGQVAAYFLSNQTTILPTLSAATVERFEHLISALANALPSNQP